MEHGVGDRLTILGTECKEQLAIGIFLSYSMGTDDIRP